MNSFMAARLTARAIRVLEALNRRQRRFTRVEVIPRNCSGVSSIHIAPVWLVTGDSALPDSETSRKCLQPPRISRRIRPAAFLPYSDHRLFIQCGVPELIAHKTTARRLRKAPSILPCKARTGPGRSRGDLLGHASCCLRAPFSASSPYTSLLRNIRDTTLERGCRVEKSCIKAEIHGRTG